MNRASPSAAQLQAERELLAECALLAHRNAAICCPDAAAAGHTCRVYHSVWPAARLIGMVASPGADRAFWESAMSALPAANARPRVLVSGASDYAFPALVADSLRHAGIVPRLHVIDRCETPLRLNRWYAEKTGLDLSTECSDVLAFTATEPYDLICAHGFIDQLPAERWPALMQRWRAALKPGALAITSNRLRSAAEAEADQHAAARPLGVAALLATANAGLPPSLQLPEQDFAPDLERYWAQRRSPPFRDAGSIIALFESADFAIVQREEDIADAPGRRSRSRRLNLIARRR